MERKKNLKHTTVNNCEYRKKQKQWVSIIKHINKCQDFYKLFALSVLVEARIHQVKPDNIDIKKS